MRGTQNRSEGVYLINNKSNQLIKAMNNKEYLEVQKSLIMNDILGNI